MHHQMHIHRTTQPAAVQYDKLMCITAGTSLAPHDEQLHTQRTPCQCHTSICQSYLATFEASDTLHALVIPHTLVGCRPRQVVFITVLKCHVVTASISAKHGLEQPPPTHHQSIRSYTTESCASLHPSTSNQACKQPVSRRPLCGPPDNKELQHSQRGKRDSPWGERDGG